jgi:hypothetical protein
MQLSEGPVGQPEAQRGGVALIHNTQIVCPFTATQPARARDKSQRHVAQQQASSVDCNVTVSPSSTTPSSYILSLPLSLQDGKLVMRHSSNQAQRHTELP